ncbi:MAG: MFS transporter [Planctomycetales bacterium]|nr:MFS transporter [Planctomycetales bacterium]
MPLTNVRWLVFGLACATSFLLYLHRYSWNIIGPKLQEEFSLTNTQTAFLFSLFYYTYASGQIPSGIVADRFGPHRFLTAIVAVWSVAIAGIAYTGNLLLLGFWRLLFGAAQAGCYPSLTNISHEWFPSRMRTTLQGWVATTFGRAGGAMSPIILGTLLMGVCGFQWQLALTLIAGVGIIHCFVFYFAFRDSPQHDPRVNDAERELLTEGKATVNSAKPQQSVLPLKNAVRNRSLKWFTIQQFLDAGSDVVFVGLIGTYFLMAHEFDIRKTGWLASLPLWGGALGGIVGGWLNDMFIRRTGNRRWTRSIVGFVGKVIGCGMLVLVVMQSDGVTAAWLLMAAKFFSDWSQPTTWGTCTDLGGRFSATVFSIINTAGTIGGIVMPIVFGVVLDMFTTSSIVDGSEVTLTNWNPLFALLSGMYLVSGACWLMVNCTERIHNESEN